MYIKLHKLRDYPKTVIMGLHLPNYSVREDVPKIMEERLNEIIENTLNEDEKKLYYLRYRDKLTYKELKSKIPLDDYSLRREIFNILSKAFTDKNLEYINDII